MLDFSVTLVITIINIVILTLILRAILWKPVTKFMAARTKRIQDSIDKSENDKNEASSLLAMRNAKLKEAYVEAEAIIRSARETARVEAEKIISEGHVLAEQSLVSAKKQIEKEHQMAMEVFKKEAASLVVKAAGRLVGREIHSEDNRQYAVMALEEAPNLMDAPFKSETGKN